MPLRLPYERLPESPPWLSEVTDDDGDVEYRPFRVNESTFNHCFKKLVANFGQYLDQQGVEQAFMLYYESLFRLEVTKEGEGHKHQPHDSALYQATLALVRRRNERGMPRVAELREMIEFYFDVAQAVGNTEQIRIKIEVAQAQAVLEGNRRRERSDG